MFFPNFAAEERDEPPPSSWSQPVLASLDEAAIRKVALKNHNRGELQFVREANFVAFVSPVEAVAHV